MEVGFKYNQPKTPKPVRIEQVFAEKPGGGRVENADYEILQTTAVGLNSDGIYAPIKAYRLTDKVVAADTTIKIAKGSGIAVGDIIGHGSKAVACTAIDQSNEDYDLVTVTLGVAIDDGTVLYQAKAASSDAAEPKYAPLFVTGNDISANSGDHMVRLINGANLRKETANIASEVAALLPTITLV